MRAKKNLEKNFSDEGNLTTGTEEADGEPRKIGVMNPYVLVRMLSPSEKPRKLHEVDIGDPDNLRLMNKQFKSHGQVKKTTSYKQLHKFLFDPEKSPLYKPLIIETGSGSPSPAITYPPTGYGPLPGNPPYIIRDPGRSAVFGDVIQGGSIDCYFLAALHSTAWMRYSAFPPDIGGIAFYPAAGGQLTPVAVTTSFPLDANQNPVYAQKSLPEAYEYWGLAWEKGYAQFKNLPKSTLPGATGVQGVYPYDPDISQFPDGDPLQSLVHITGLSYNFASVPPTAYAIDATHNPDCYTTLSTLNKTGGTATSGMTKYPTVAWTKSSCPNLSPALVASHSYSVLGIFKNATTNIKYIVLRNPWGIPFNTGQPGLEPLAGSLAHEGAFKPTTINIAISLGPDSEKGIFGLENTAFNTYFAGFGWVR